MMNINRWDYVAPITRKSWAWTEEDNKVRSQNREWKIERWWDEEFGWMQMHTATYIDDDGREIETSMTLFPDDYSKEDMLYYAALGEIDLPPEKYDETSREEIIELFERQVEAMTTFTLLRKWLICKWQNFCFPFRMKRIDLEIWLERKFKMKGA